MSLLKSRKLGNIISNLRFLKGELKDTNLDTSQLKKYSKMDLKGSTEEIIKRVKVAKNIEVGQNLGDTITGFMVFILFYLSLLIDFESLKIVFFFLIFFFI